MESIEPIYWAVAGVAITLMAMVSMIYVVNADLDARKAANVELAETEALSRLATSMVIEKGGRTNYALLSRRLSGSGEKLDTQGFSRLATGMSYLSLNAEGGGNSFNIYLHGSRSTSREGGSFRLPVPVRGGEKGSVRIDYEVLNS